MPTTLTLTNPIHPPLAETVAPNRTMAGGGLYFALMLPLPCCTASCGVVARLAVTNRIAAAARLDDVHEIGRALASLSVDR